MTPTGSTIFNDFLSRLEVKHTESYSNARFAAMPFHTMFGMTKLLDEYGVDSTGILLGNTNEIAELPVPFISQTRRGLVIVTQLSDKTVQYVSQSVDETADRSRFEQAMTGKVLVAFPRSDAREPDYEAHRFSDAANHWKKWVLAAGSAALLIYLVIANGLINHVSTAALVLIDLAGLYISFLLVQKSAHIKNRHADAVCSVVEAGGCDDILNTSASKFFGIFGWSEVGLAYFAVSLGALLMFPQHIGTLALCNLLCLPFSFWSVWYQKFKAKTWCTLCLCVQSLLWLSFFSYLGGGWLKDILPLQLVPFVVLGLTYLCVMLGINALMPFIDRQNKTDQHEG